MALFPGARAIGAGHGREWYHHRPARSLTNPDPQSSGGVNIGAFQDQGYTLALLLGKLSEHVRQPGLRVSAGGRVDRER